MCRKNGKKDTAVPNTDRSVEALIEKVLNEIGEGISNQLKKSKVKKVQNKQAGNESGEGTSQGASSCQSPKWTKKRIS
ncbi:hypothetical protein Tco_1257370, partial [Tanacetum coccineum]